MSLILVVVLGIILVPSISLAWGPLTHMYLANEIFSYAPLIPAGIYSLLKNHRQDFLYGNLMADTILGKKYLPDHKSSHSWDVGLRLFCQATSWSQKAFTYGYLSHLAADTVAHEILTENLRNAGHTWAELKADSVINKNYWIQSVMISRAVQRRNDHFLSSTLDRFIFSFNTNKRIYKGMVFFSFLNKKRHRGIDREFLSHLHAVSLMRMLDLLRNGTDAQVLNRSPL